MKTGFLVALFILTVSAASAEGGVENKIAWIIRVDYDSEEIVLETVDTKETIVACMPTTAGLDFFASRTNWLTAIRFECGRDKDGACVFAAKPHFFLAGEEVDRWTIVRRESAKMAKRAP